MAEHQWKERPYWSLWLSRWWCAVVKHDYGTFTRYGISVPMCKRCQACRFTVRLDPVEEKPDHGR